MVTPALAGTKVISLISLISFRICSCDFRGSFPWRADQNDPRNHTNRHEQEGTNARSRASVTIRSWLTLGTTSTRNHRLKVYAMSSEGELQAQLNVAWRSRSPDCSECCITAIVFKIPEVSAIECIENVSLKLQINLLT